MSKENPVVHATIANREPKTDHRYDRERAVSPNSPCRLDERLDEALEHTFPGSDPVSSLTFS